MSITVFVTVLALSFGVFAVPRSVKYFYTLILIAIVVVLSTAWGFRAFSDTSRMVQLQIGCEQCARNFILQIDRLSAFFILVVNLTVLTGFLYARGYLEPYYKLKDPLRFSIHYLAYLWLYFSMLLVVSIRDGLSFLIVWEIMALSSFLLVIFDAEDRNVMKTGINYLIQMHVGMLVLLIAFIIIFKETDWMSFDALGAYFSRKPNLPVFLLFFVGFGIKAGFIPLHTWLPQAHPAAPSHVSGVMSGVMIKMGIYGILRVILELQNDLWAIGIILLIVSLVSGMLGVMMAIMQHDLKKLLAYHSIENIGIIGIGLGLGVIGLASGNYVLSLLGFTGGILHVLNHSLFKSLLFFNAGSVYLSTHTRNIEKMGGLMKRMPYTALLFLVGSLAICGLPPFNGFISEYLIYLGMFKSLSFTNLYQSFLVLGSILGLAAIGGLAIFCFTKAFGIVFLGEPRSEMAAGSHEMGKNMLIPQLIPVFFIVIIGLASWSFVRPLLEMVIQDFRLPGMETALGPASYNLSRISIISGIFVVMVTGLLLYRKFHFRNKKIEYGPTWGCGYTAPTSKLQYTATSYADNYARLARPFLAVRRNMQPIREDEIFPAKRHFESHSFDIFKKYLIDTPVNFFLEILKKLAIMQTGQIQHYILYLFVYILLLFLLTYFNLI